MKLIYNNEQNNFFKRDLYSTVSELSLWPTCGIRDSEIERKK